MRFLAYRFILPCLWLNSLLGNQVWYPSIHSLGVTFFYLGGALVAYCIVQIWGKHAWPYVLMVAVVVSRVALAIEAPGAEAAYALFLLLLFLLAGVILGAEAPGLLEKQSRIFFTVSVPVLLLQVGGVAEWLHAFNTLYAVSDLSEVVYRPTVRMLPAFFASTEELTSTMYSDYREFFAWQTRPPGLTHSSALLGIVLLAGAAVHLGRLKGRGIGWYDCFMVASVILCGSKLAVLGFLLLLAWTYIRSEAPLRQRTRRIGLLYVGIFALYVIIFPAVVEHNFSRDQLEVSIAIRAADAILKIAPEAAMALPAILDIVAGYQSTFSYTAGTLGQLSGIATLLIALPVIMVAALLGLPWIVKGIRYCRATYPEVALTAELMTVAMIASAVATPIFGSQLYALFLGVAVVPVGIGLSPVLRRQLARAAQRQARQAAPAPRLPESAAALGN